MKTCIVAACIAALCVGSPAIAEEPTTDQAPMIVAQVPVYHFINSFGMWFWGVTYDTGLVECQINTPTGALCFYRGYW